MDRGGEQGGVRRFIARGGLCLAALNGDFELSMKYSVLGRH